MLNFFLIIFFLFIFCLTVREGIENHHHTFKKNIESNEENIDPEVLEEANQLENSLSKLKFQTNKSKLANMEIEKN